VTAPQEPNDTPTRQFGEPPFLVWSSRKCPGSRDVVTIRIDANDGTLGVSMHNVPTAQARAFAAALLAAAERAEGKS